MEKIDKKTENIVSGLIEVAKKHASKIRDLCQYAEEIVKENNPNINLDGFEDEIYDVIYGDNEPEILFERMKIEVENI